MTIQWPDSLVPRSCDPEPRNFASSGGRAGDGREQRVFSDAGFWEVQLDSFPVNTTEQVNAWRAVIARLRTGEDIILKVFDAHKPGNFGADSATLAAAAGLRATVLEIAGSGVRLSEGQHLGLGGDRLHRVTQVLADVKTNVGLVRAISGDDAWSDAAVWVDDQADAMQVKVLPPLRAAYANGAAVSLKNLKLRCVLKDMASGDLKLDMGRHGSPSIAFIESI